MKQESNQTVYSISAVPAEDRPRERLARFGPDALSTAELIAVILGSGTKKIPIMQLAHEIVLRFGDLRRLSEATLSELCQIKGIGSAKAIQLKAALSLGPRVARQTTPQKYRIENPIQAYYLLKDELGKEKRELFVVILLDVKGQVICHEVVAIGTLSQALIHPREVFYPAIRHKASSLILAHNHPSGDPTPSVQDFEVTEKLINAGKMMNIPVFDHIIIGDSSYISLRQKGIRF
jgi:DNA repair protein RadC